jgi:hypothetical protein
MDWREELKDRLRQADAIVEKDDADVVIVRRSTLDRRTGGLKNGPCVLVESYRRRT